MEDTGNFHLVRETTTGFTSYRMKVSSPDPADYTSFTGYMTVFHIATLKDPNRDISTYGLDYRSAVLQPSSP